MISFFGGEQVGHAENLVHIGKGFQVGGTGHDKVNRASLGQLDGFLGRAKQLIGEYLNLVLIAQVGFHIFFELEQAKVFGVGFGLCMRNANDALAARQRTGTAGCRCQHNAADAHAQHLLEVFHGGSSFFIFRWAGPQRTARRSVCS